MGTYSLFANEDVDHIAVGIPEGRADTNDLPVRRGDEHLAELG